MADKRQAWVTEEQFLAWLDSLPSELRRLVASVRRRRVLTPAPTESPPPPREPEKKQ